jgi:hypothetical protein
VQRSTLHTGCISGVAAHAGSDSLAGLHASDSTTALNCTDNTDWNELGSVSVRLDQDISAVQPGSVRSHTQMSSESDSRANHKWHDDLACKRMQIVLATVGADSMGHCKLPGWQVPAANNNGGWCRCVTRGETWVSCLLPVHRYAQICFLFVFLFAFLRNKTPQVSRPLSWTLNRASCFQFHTAIK